MQRTIASHSIIRIVYLIIACSLLGYASIAQAQDEPQLFITTDPNCLPLEGSHYYSVTITVRIQGNQLPYTLYFSDGNLGSYRNSDITSPDPNYIYEIPYTFNVLGNEPGQDNFTIELVYGANGDKKITYKLPTFLKVDVDIDPKCNPAPDKPHLTANVSGGTSPYTIYWGGYGVNGSNTFTADGRAETITVHVVDSKGCEAYKTVTIGDPVSVYAEHVQSCHGCNFLVSVSGGVQPINVYIDPPVTRSGGNGSPTNPVQYGPVDCDQVYNILVEDFNGCRKTITAKYHPEPNGGVQSHIEEERLWDIYTNVNVGTGSGIGCTTPVSLSIGNGAYDFMSMSSCSFAYYDAACLESNNFDDTECTAAGSTNPVSLQPGRYYVKITLPDGCPYWVEVTVKPCGTHQQGDPPHLTVNPNPNLGICQVAIEHFYEEPIHIKVFNGSGGLVADSDLGLQQPGIVSTHLDLTQQQSGVYYLVTTVGNTQMNPVQVVKQ
jgi:hypothetical protein